MALKPESQPELDKILGTVQEQRLIRGSWPYLGVDRKYSPLIEQVAQAAQQSSGPILTTPNHRNFYIERMPSERYSILTTAQPNSKICAEMCPIDSEIMKKAYGIAYSGVKTIDTIDRSVQRVAYIFNEWGNALNTQKKNLRKCFTRLPKNKSMRMAAIMQRIEKCEEYLNEVRRYGISKAARVFSKNLTKEEGIKHIKDICKIITDSPLTKSIKIVTKSLEVMKKILRPIMKVLNKIPGFRYLEVFEKIFLGTRALFQYDFDKAFVSFVDGLRLLLEQILVDFVIGAAITAGGWVALVIALVVIIAVLLIDYFLFNDDPDNSWLPTTHLTTQLKPAMNKAAVKFDEAMIQYGEREFQKGGWGGPKI